eukprot:gene26263-biopygen15387
MTFPGGPKQSPLAGSDSLAPPESTNSLAERFQWLNELGFGSAPRCSSFPRDCFRRYECRSNVHQGGGGGLG